MKNCLPTSVYPFTNVHVTYYSVNLSESNLKRTLSINLETQHGSKRTRNFSLSFISKEDARSIFNHLKSISEKNVSELSA